HSISEVMALADNVLAMDQGRVVAFGPPRRLLYQPSVYPLVGEEELENIVEAEVVGHDARLRLTEARLGCNRLLLPLVDRPPGSKLTLAIGASDPIISLNAPEGISAQNLLSGRIESVHVVERRALVYVDVGVPLVVQVGANAVRKLELREGLQVHLILKTTTAMLIDARPS
ncbi:MAG: hypothetical protein Q8O40_11490, partial [Chloroflexota bacterium]|nr:hypothetical protein [Chloroflexota bacterium]